MAMPLTRVVLFKEDDGTVPMKQWLDRLAPKAVAKCISRIERLRSLGYELRRPEADLLQDGIYELRVGFGGVNYRMLYFFYGNLAAVVSHGLVKERIVPPIEIERARHRRDKFVANPARHTQEF